MKIKIKKLFRYQVGPRKVKELQPGIYDVGKDITQHLCDSVLRFGKAEVFIEPVVKKAPEKKVVEAPENKSKVAKTPVRRRSARPKSNE